LTAPVTVWYLGNMTAMSEGDHERLRALTNEVDAYFSLLWWRYTKKTDIPDDLRFEIEQVLSRLRAYNDKGIV